MPAYLRNQHSITLRNTHWYSLAILVESTRSNSQNLSFVELLDTALGKEDTTGSLGFGFYSLDKNSVQKGYERSDGLE